MGISLDSEPESTSPTARDGDPPAAPALSRHALREPAPPVAPRQPPAPAELASPLPAAREMLWNLPNSITMLRAVVVPVLLLYPVFPSEPWSTALAWFFIAAAVSDLIDGWLARRGQQVTHIGKLLDPLADKLLVSTALIVLVATPGRIPGWALWMVVTIVGRELAVTGLRGIASAGGQVVAASGLGKLKTVTQNIAIGALLFHYETIGLDAHAVGLFFLCIATALTIASGYRYFADYFAALRGGEVAPPDGKTP